MMMRDGRRWVLKLVLAGVAAAAPLPAAAQNALEGESERVAPLAALVPLPTNDALDANRDIGPIEIDGVLEEDA